MLIQDIVVFAKKHIILVCIWVSLLVMIFYLMILNWYRSIDEVSCDMAVLLINKRNAIVLDIRNQDDYYSGYINNSVNVPFVSSTRNDFLNHEKYKEKPIIIVSNTNNRFSYKFKKLLKTLGYSEVYVLKGGIYSWKENKLPVFFNKK